MNKTNKDEALKFFCSELKKREKKPKLLLHACCAPCLSGCFERLLDYFSLTVYFYNPNIDKKEEYEFRLLEVEKFCKNHNLALIKEDYLKPDFINAVIGLENEPERGKRCDVCFGIRLAKTAKHAKANGYDYFATTLTLSPLKSADKLNLIGKQIEELIGAKYLETDFKKRGGYARSIEISKAENLYRQNYCGCEFSKKTSKEI